MADARVRAMTDPSRCRRLEDNLCFAAYQANHAFTAAYRPLLEPLGLTYPQYLVMLVLWEWQLKPPELPTVKALGERLLLDSGTLTPLLKRLETQGLVRRRRAASDEREVHLALTDTGWVMREQVPALQHALLCQHGVDLNELVALRNQLGGLLNQLTLPNH